MFCCCFKKNPIKEPLIKDGNENETKKIKQPEVAETKIPFSNEDDWRLYDEKEEIKEFSNEEYLKTLYQAKQLEEKIAFKREIYNFRPPINRLL